MIDIYKSQSLPSNSGRRVRHNFTHTKRLWAYVLKHHYHPLHHQKPRTVSVSGQHRKPILINIIKMDDDKFYTSRFQMQFIKYGNYYVWSSDNDVYLRGKGLCKYAAGTATAPTKRTYTETKAKYEKERDMCLFYLLISIDQSCKFAVMKKRDPNYVWTTLQRTYQKVSESLIETESVTRDRNGEE